MSSLGDIVLHPSERFSGRDAIQTPYAEYNVGADLPKASEKELCLGCQSGAASTVCLKLKVYAILIQSLVKQWLTCPFARLLTGAVSPTARKCVLPCGPPLSEALWGACYVAFAARSTAA